MVIVSRGSATDAHTDPRDEYKAGQTSGSMAKSFWSQEEQCECANQNQVDYACCVPKSEAHRSQSKLQAAMRHLYSGQGQGLRHLRRWSRWLKREVRPLSGSDITSGNDGLFNREPSSGSAAEGRGVETASALYGDVTHSSYRDIFARDGSRSLATPTAENQPPLSILWQAVETGIQFIRERPGLGCERQKGIKVVRQDLHLELKCSNVNRDDDDLIRGTNRLHLKWKGKRIWERQERSRMVAQPSSRQSSFGIAEISPGPPSFLVFHCDPRYCRINTMWFTVHHSNSPATCIENHSPSLACAQRGPPHHLFDSSAGQFSSTGPQTCDFECKCSITLYPAIAVMHGLGADKSISVVGLPEPCRWKLQAGDSVCLQFQFDSKISTLPEGLYRSGGGQGNAVVLTTVFEQMFSRRLYPCIDLPRSKTRIALSILKHLCPTCRHEVPPLDVVATCPLVRRRTWIGENQDDDELWRIKSQDDVQRAAGDPGNALSADKLDASPACELLEFALSPILSPHSFTFSFGPFVRIQGSRNYLDPALETWQPKSLTSNSSVFVMCPVKQKRENGCQGFRHPFYQFSAKASSLPVTRQSSPNSSQSNRLYALRIATGIATAVGNGALYWNHNTEAAAGLETRQDNFFAPAALRLETCLSEYQFVANFGSEMLCLIEREIVGGSCSGSSSKENARNDNSSLQPSSRSNWWESKMLSPLGRFVTSKEVSPQSISGGVTTEVGLLPLRNMRGLGLENHGLISIHHEFLTVTPRCPLHRLIRICRLVVHELIHQWVGNLSTPSTFVDGVWLKEGLTRYLEFLLLFHWVNNNPKLSDVAKSTLLDLIGLSLLVLVRCEALSIDCFVSPVNTASAKGNDRSPETPIRSALPSNQCVRGIKSAGQERSLQNAAESPSRDWTAKLWSPIGPKKWETEQGAPLTLRSRPLRLAADNHSPLLHHSELLELYDSTAYNKTAMVLLMWRLNGVSWEKGITEMLRAGSWYNADDFMSATEKHRSDVRQPASTLDRRSGGACLDSELSNSKMADGTSSDSLDENMIDPPQSPWFRSESSSATRFAPPAKSPSVPDLQQPAHLPTGAWGLESGLASEASHRNDMGHHRPFKAAATHPLPKPTSDPSVRESPRRCKEGNDSARCSDEGLFLGDFPDVCVSADWNDETHVAEEKSPGIPSHPGRLVTAAGLNTFEILTPWLELQGYPFVFWRAAASPHCCEKSKYWTVGLRQVSSHFPYGVASPTRPSSAGSQVASVNKSNSLTALVHDSIWPIPLQLRVEMQRSCCAPNEPNESQTQHRTELRIWTTRFVLASLELRLQLHLKHRHSKHLPRDHDWVITDVTLEDPTGIGYFVLVPVTSQPRSNSWQMGSTDSLRDKIEKDEEENYSMAPLGAFPKRRKIFSETANLKAAEDTPPQGLMTSHSAGYYEDKKVDEKLFLAAPTHCASSMALRAIREIGDGALSSFFCQMVDQKASRSYDLAGVQVKDGTSKILEGIRRDVLGISPEGDNTPEIGVIHCSCHSNGISKISANTENWVKDDVDPKIRERQRALSQLSTAESADSVEPLHSQVSGLVRERTQAPGEHADPCCHLIGELALAPENPLGYLSAGALSKGSPESPIYGVPQVAWKERMENFSRNAVAVLNRVAIFDPAGPQPSYSSFSEAGGLYHPSLPIRVFVQKLGKFIAEKSEIRWYQSAEEGSERSAHFLSTAVVQEVIQAVGVVWPESDIAAMPSPCGITNEPHIEPGWLMLATHGVLNG